MLEGREKEGVNELIKLHSSYSILLYYYVNMLYTYKFLVVIKHLISNWYNTIGLIKNCIAMPLLLLFVNF